MTAVLGAEGQAISDDELGARGLRFAVGTHRLEYLMPSEPRGVRCSGIWMRTGPCPGVSVL